MQHNWRRGLQPKGTSANSHRSEPFLDQTRITHTRNGTRRVCRDGYRFRSPPRRKLRRSFFPAGLNEDFIGHCFPIKEFHFSYSKAGFRAAAGFDARNFFHWPAERHRRGLVFPGITPLAGDLWIRTSSEAFVPRPIQCDFELASVPLFPALPFGCDNLSSWTSEYKVLRFARIGEWGQTKRNE